MKPTNFPNGIRAPMLNASGAQPTAIVDLTDNSGGTANDTIEACGTAVTGVDGAGSNAASKADVDARLTAIANNFADLTAKVNELNAALQAAQVTDS